jgi:hypothetical protein
MPNIHQDDKTLYILAVTSATFVTFHVSDTGASLPAGLKLFDATLRNTLCPCLRVWCQDLQRNTHKVGSW